MIARVSADRLRLVRDVAQAEKELDKALMLLGRTQKAMVDAGARIAELHASLLDNRRIVEIPPGEMAGDDAGEGGS